MSESAYLLIKRTTILTYIRTYTRVLLLYQYLALLLLVFTYTLVRQLRPLPKRIYYLCSSNHL